MTIRGGGNPRLDMALEPRFSRSYSRHACDSLADVA